MTCEGVIETLKEQQEAHEKNAYEMDRQGRAIEYIKAWAAWNALGSLRARLTNKFHGIPVSESSALPKTPPWEGALGVESSPSVSTEEEK